MLIEESIYVVCDTSRGPVYSAYNATSACRVAAVADAACRLAGGVPEATGGAPTKQVTVT